MQAVNEKPWKFQKWKFEINETQISKILLRICSLLKYVMEIFHYTNLWFRPSGLFTFLRESDDTIRCNIINTPIKSSREENNEHGRTVLNLSPMRIKCTTDYSNIKAEELWLEMDSRWIADNLSKSHTSVENANLGQFQFKNSTVPLLS